MKYIKLFEAFQSIILSKTLGYIDKESKSKFLDHVKKVCSDCPFQKDCLDWGVKHESFGIWGGATEYERSLIRKKLNIKFKSLEKYFA